MALSINQILAAAKVEGMELSKIKTDNGNYFLMQYRGEEGTVNVHAIGQMDKAKWVEEVVAFANSVDALKQVEARRAAAKAEAPAKAAAQESNGIKRPREGGKCRSVWDACDHMLAKMGATPAAKNIKAWAADKGYNQNNALIELYRWRKFNGLGK